MDNLLSRREYYGFPNRIENDAIEAFFGIDKVGLIRDRIHNGDFRETIVMIITYLEKSERSAYDRKSILSMLDHISRLTLPGWRQRVTDVLRNSKDREHFLRALGGLSLYFSQSKYPLFGKQELLTLFRDAFSLEFDGR